MDECDEVGGGIKNGDVLEDAEILLAHSRFDIDALEARNALDGLHEGSSHKRDGGGMHGIGGNLDEQSNEPEGENDLPSLQRASNTSVQNSKSLSVVDVVAVRRRAAPAIGKSTVDSAGNSACSGSRGQENGLEAHSVCYIGDRRRGLGGGVQSS